MSTDETLKSLISKYQNKDGKVLIRLIHRFYNEENPESKWEKTNSETLTKYFTKRRDFEVFRISPGNHLVSLSPTINEKPKTTKTKLSFSVNKKNHDFPHHDEDFEKVLLEKNKKIQELTKEVTSLKENKIQIQQIKKSFPQYQNYRKKKQRIKIIQNSCGKILRFFGCNFHRKVHVFTENEFIRGCCENIKCFGEWHFEKEVLIQLECRNCDSVKKISLNLEELIRCDCGNKVKNPIRGYQTILKGLKRIFSCFTKNPNLKTFYIGIRSFQTRNYDIYRKGGIEAMQYTKEFLLKGI